MHRGSLDLIVINPNDAIENVWQNSQSVPKPYNGKSTFISHSFHPEAITLSLGLDVKAVSSHCRAS